jgi:hypothetical protein
MVEIELLLYQVLVRGEEQVHIRSPLPGARSPRLAGPPLFCLPGNWLDHRDGSRWEKLHCVEAGDMPSFYTQGVVCGGELSWMAVAVNECADVPSILV